MTENTSKCSLPFVTRFNTYQIICITQINLCKNLPTVLEEENDVPCEIFVNNEDVILPDELWDANRGAFILFYAYNKTILNKLPIHCILLLKNFLRCFLSRSSTTFHSPYTHDLYRVFLAPFLA
jgi:hypothetical protein